LRGDLPLELLAGFRAAGHDHHRGAEAGQFGRDHPADPAGSAGHHAHPPGQVRRCGRRGVHAVSPVRPWLRGQLRAFADEIVLPAVAGVALAMMNRSGSSLPAEVHDRFSATADTGLRAAVALAVADGELTEPADPEDIMALLSGPLIHRACLQGNPVSDELIDRVIDSIGTWHPHS
jgi:hypothetical protein